MDLSGEYSDLLKDESFIKVLKEMDSISVEESVSLETRESNIAAPTQNLKTQTLSINSTRYGSETSSVELGYEPFNRFSKQWRCYQKRFDLHISKTVKPLLSYMLENPIVIDGRQVYFTKKKAYLERLVEETISSYKQKWKEVYLPLCYNSSEEGTEAAGSYKTTYSEEEAREYGKLVRELSVAEGNYLSRCSTTTSREGFQQETNQEDLTDVFIETGYRNELVEIIYRNGVEYFYHLVDFVITVIEKTNYKYKIVQSLDLITTMIKVMPELSVLLIVPKNKDSKILNEKKCYFKMLVEKIKRRLGMKSNTVLEVYKSFLKGSFMPFYMVNPYEAMKKDKKEQDDEEMEVDGERKEGKDELVMVYTLDRMLNLVTLVSEKVFEFLNMKMMEETRSSLTKKIKKYLFIPFLGMETLHELFLTFSGNFKMEEVRVPSYRNLLRKYLYPPPPLNSLRIRTLDLLELLSSADLVKYKENFFKANRRIIQSEPVSGMNQKVDKVLVNYLHLLSFGSSFLLMGEFMKRSVEAPSTFFGNYLFLLPHFRINFSRINETRVIEESVYVIEKKILNFLTNLNESRIFTNDNFMNLKSVNLVQNNILKRLISIIMHYVENTTESEIEDAELDFNIDNEFNRINHQDHYCNELCESIVPYNTASIIEYFFKKEIKEEIFKQEKGDLEQQPLHHQFYHQQFQHEQPLQQQYQLLLQQQQEQECQEEGGDIFVFNKEMNFTKEIVDVSNFEELDKIARQGLTTRRYYVPLENTKEMEYAVESRPYIDYKSNFTKYMNYTPLTSSRLSSGRSKSSQMREENSGEIAGKRLSFSNERTVEESVPVSLEEQDNTVREEGVETGRLSREKCGWICLVNRHMIEESKFKRIFDLRKEVVLKALETMSSYPTKHLGDLEEVYVSFLKRLMS